MASKQQKKVLINDQSIYGQSNAENRHTKEVLGKLLLVSTIGNVVLAALCTLQFVTKEPPIINNYAVDAQGRITKLEPVNQELGIERVSLFLTETVKEAFSMNYRNYEEKMTAVAGRFSSGAYTDYRKGMTDGESSIVSVLKMTSASVDTIPTAMRLVQKTEVRGRAAWIIDIDVNRTFFAAGSEKTVPITYRATVVRESSMITPNMLVVYAMVEAPRTPGVAR